MSSKVQAELPGVPSGDTGLDAQPWGSLGSTSSSGLSVLSSTVATVPAAVWSHPLATPQAQALIAGLIAQGKASSVADAIQLVAFASEGYVAADGTEYKRHRVWEADVTFDPNAQPPVEYVAPAVARVHDNVVGLLADPSSSADVVLYVRGTWGGTKPFSTIQTALLPLLADGTVTDHASQMVAEQALYTSRVNAGQLRLNSLASLIQSLGGVIEEEDPFSLMMVVEMPEAAVSTLRASPLVNYLEVKEGVLENDCDIDDPAGSDGGFTLHGQELAGLIQAQQFYDQGYFASDVQYALLEPSAAKVHRTHPGFLSGGGAGRFENCAPPGCIDIDPGQNKASACLWWMVSRSAGKICLIPQGPQQSLAPISSPGVSRKPMPWFCVPRHPLARSVSAKPI